MGIERAGARVEDDGLGVAMTDGEDTGRRVRERRSHGPAVEGQADKTAEMGAGILGLFAKIEPVTDAQDQRVRDRGGVRAVIGNVTGQEGHTAAIMDVGTAARFGGEENLEIQQSVPVQPTAPEMQRVVARRAGRPGEVDMAGLLEIGRQGDVQETALAGMQDFGHAGYGVAELAIGSDRTQAPGLFGDQHAAIGQEGEAPGVFQTFRHDLRRLGRGCGAKHQAGQETGKNTLHRLSFDCRPGGHTIGFAGPC